ncbi:MAG: DUF6776 family protein, partial [Quisquiliibacterium sp.]
MKLKLLLRQLSVSAPRMTVRRHVPWPLRFAAQAALVLMLAGAGVWGWLSLTHDAELQRQALLSRVQDVQAKLAAETAQREQAVALAGAAEARLRVERTALERLAAQVRSLEGENAHLKADLTYLESLLPAGRSEGPIAIRRLEVQPDAKPGHLRYRALLTQDARADKDFEGTFQLVLTLSGPAKANLLTLPSENETLGYRVSFRRFRRVEGIVE